MVSLSKAPNDSSLENSSEIGKIRFTNPYRSIFGNAFKRSRPDLSPVEGKPSPLTMPEDCDEDEEDITEGEEELLPTDDDGKH